MKTIRHVLCALVATTLLMLITANQANEKWANDAMKRSEVTNAASIAAIDANQDATNIEPAQATAIADKALMKDTAATSTAKNTAQTAATTMANKTTASMAAARATTAMVPGAQVQLRC